MVRITTIARSGIVATIDLPGTVSGAARAIADARQGAAIFNCPAGDQIRICVTDIVLMQLLDGEQAVSEPSA
jgi:hypothetical protein